VPEIDPAYVFDKEATTLILAGFAHNRRVLLQGFHGTGKSTHLEQVAARLNWPCVRVNLDSHISRLDLVGRDAIVLQDGKQITEFREGILPWALQRAIALVFDEYDAGRPDVMFVIQRVLEANGKLMLLDQNRLLSPHPAFRLFATANTIGMGDTTGLYHGTQLINQGQMDRWNLIGNLKFMPTNQEIAMVSGRLKQQQLALDETIIKNMVTVAGLIRKAFAAQDISSLLSPRSVVAWAENTCILGDVALAFRATFLAKCDETEKPLIAEYYQRCFGVDLPESLYSRVVE
jgi:cobaltochelatase CobS